MREFETGAVRDSNEGKGRCDLMPLDTIANIYFYFGKPSLVFRCIDGFVKSCDVTFLYNALQGFDGFSDLHDMFLEVACHFEEGAKKYGEHNWQKGIPTNCYIDSAVRHYLKYLRGDKDERHDRAFVWNVLCCIWTCEQEGD